MAAKILIVRWTGSAYDSLGGLLELTAQELAAEGAEVVVLPAEGPDMAQRVVEVARDGGFTFALTMSGIGSDIFIERQLAWEALKLPLFNWSCDHACYFPSRHALRSRYLLHGYVFPDHARYNVAHLSPNGAAFSVHVGIPPRTVFPGAPLPAARRNGRLVYFKSCADTNAIEANWRARNGPVLQRLLFSAAEELFHRSTGDFLPVLQRLGEPLGLALDGANVLALALIRELDAYIRHRRSNLLITALLNHPVDVFGVGWDHIPWSTGRGAAYRGVATWRSFVSELPRYLGCLSTNPLVEDSVHDRVFFALAAGVPPVSDANRFSRAHMPALSPYHFDFRPARIVATADAVLANPEEAVARTEATHAAMLPAFAMRRSAQQLLQFAGLYTVNARFGQ